MLFRSTREGCDNGASRLKRQQFQRERRSVDHFTPAAGLTGEAFGQWLLKEKPSLTALSARLEPALGGLEFLATMTDGKTHCRRVRSEPFKNSAAAASEWLDQLANQSGIKITVQA